MLGLVNSELDRFIEDQAEAASLEEAMIVAIINQESMFNNYAIRYEPTYRWLFEADHYAKFLGISLDTETFTQKCSWGLGQIMGAVAREQGHVGPMGQLFEPERNIKQMIILIQSIKKRGAKSLDDIFSCYNAGMNALLKKQSDGVYPNTKYVQGCNMYYNRLKG